jgi:hypothetical protein
VPPEAVLAKVESAEEERGDGSVTLPFPVGSDERAWFYRLSTAPTSLTGLFLHLPSREGSRRCPRALRLPFRAVELISPSPRRQTTFPSSLINSLTPQAFRLILTPWISKLCQFMSQPDPMPSCRPAASPPEIPFTGISPA